MKFDFSSTMDRHGQDAIAIDGLGMMPGLAPEPPEGGFDAIPMWVADMNFPVCPSIQRAIIKRVQEPHFGYFLPRDEYYSKIIEWQRRRNGVNGLEHKHIGYENGVLGGVVSTLKAFMAPGDSVLLHSPTYIGFTMSLENNGFHIVHSPLVLDEQGVYRMDFDDMERRISEDRIHTAVFCSPHNPCGRVWERQEIERAMDIFKRHDVIVVSDEIWSDVILPGNRHIPTQSVSEDAKDRTVALYSPSKTFNLAGMVGSYHIIYSDWLRDREMAQASKSHYNEMNVLSMHALLGAYEPEGYAWVDELCQTIDRHVDWACDFIDHHFPDVKVSRPQGTYMLFLDCSDWCAKHERGIDWLERQGWRIGVDWQDGRAFHGPCHIRMNLALPLARIQEAFDRLDKYVFNT